MDMTVHQLVEVEQILMVTQQEALHHEYPLVTRWSSEVHLSLMSYVYLCTMKMNTMDLLIQVFVFATSFLPLV